MKIHGLQKTTLLDYPGKVACTIFTGGCNFRCPFCHNAALVLAPDRVETIDDDELFAFLRKRRGILDGVCVTGGEPMLNPGLPDFLRRVKALGYLVKVDTNGSFPDMLRTVTEEGLADYIAMDIKNSPARYAETVGFDAIDLSPIQESVSHLLRCGVDCEFRTTVVRELHTTEDILEIGRWISGADRYFLQAFIDSGNLIKPGFSAYSPEEMAALCAAVKPFVRHAAVRGA